jgi:hypothetical protein
LLWLAAILHFKIPVLEPDFDLALCEAQRMRNLNAAPETVGNMRKVISQLKKLQDVFLLLSWTIAMLPLCKVLVKMKFFLKLCKRLILINN